MYSLKFTLVNVGQVYAIYLNSYSSFVFEIPIYTSVLYMGIIIIYLQSVDLDRFLLFLQYCCVIFNKSIRCQFYYIINFTMVIGKR